MTYTRRRPTLITAAALIAAVSAISPAPAETRAPARGAFIALPEQRLRIPTRGGDVYARILRPETSAPVPVILTYTPYSLAFPASPSDGWVARGYARVIADVVGTGNSGGCWDYGGPRERASVYDLVQWLGGTGLDGGPSPAAAWSNGKVGMIGASYDGTTANMAAVEAPPHLAAIVPQVAISDWYSYAFGDGVRYAIMDPGQRQGAVVNEQGLDTPATFDLTYGAIPPADRTDVNPDQRYVERACPGMSDKLEHTMRGYDPDPDFDAFWRERSYIAEASKVRVPALIQGGWRDYNVKHSESSRWFEAIPLDDPSTPELDGAPFKMLVMGQTGHGPSDVVVNGSTFDALVRHFFARFLAGKTEGFNTSQPMLVSRANDGILRTDPTWPPPAVEDARLYLRAGRALTVAAPDATEGGSTLVDTARTSESDALNARAHPTPDVLWFESAPLAAPLRIAGTPALDLFAETLGTSTHLTPVLFDLGPPRTQLDPICTFASTEPACTISRGFLNARHRDGIDRGSDLTPQAPYRARVRFIDNDWVVPAGHRIAVAVMASNVWWAVPDQQRAATTIAHDLTRPSALILPVVGGDEALRTAGL